MNASSGRTGTDRKASLTAAPAAKIAPNAIRVARASPARVLTAPKQSWCHTSGSSDLGPGPGGADTLDRVKDAAADLPEPEVVGGIFGLEEPDWARNGHPQHLDGEGMIFLVNARSGVALLVEVLRPRTVWLPSYLCQAVLDAVAGGPRTEFYEVTAELRLGSLEWVRRVERGDLVVAIDYFGFPFESGWDEEARSRGAILLRDAGQALLSTTKSLAADYHLYSPRKFLGVPDGGILTSNTALDEAHEQLGEAPVEWWLDGLAATVLRRSFDRHGGAREWFELFRRYEASAPMGRYRMSQVSRRIMEATDYATVAERRVRNYGVLADLLGAIALFPELPAGVVPLGFPVRVPSRDRVRQALFEREIYPAVHWPVPPGVPERFSEARTLAAEALTLPCDQRYSPETMERIARLVRSTLEQ